MGVYRPHHNIIPEFPGLGFDALHQKQEERMLVQHPAMPEINHEAQHLLLYKGLLLLLGRFY